MYNFALLLLLFCLSFLFFFVSFSWAIDYSWLQFCLFLAYGFQCRMFSQSKRRNLQYPKILKETRLQLQPFVRVKTFLYGHLVPRVLSAFLREMSWKVHWERGYPRWILIYPVYSLLKTGGAADVTVKPGVLGRNLQVWLLFSSHKTKTCIWK